MVDFNVRLPHSRSSEKGLLGVQGLSGGWATEQDMCSHRTEHWLDWRLVQLGPLAGSLSSAFHLTNKKQKNSSHEGLCIDLWTAFCVAITCCLKSGHHDWNALPIGRVTLFKCLCPLLSACQNHISAFKVTLGHPMETLPSPSSEYSFKGKAVHVNLWRSGNCLLYQQNLLPMNHSDSTPGC